MARLVFFCSADIAFRTSLKLRFLGGAALHGLRKNPSLHLILGGVVLQHCMRGSNKIHAPHGRHYSSHCMPDERPTTLGPTPLNKHARD